MSVEIEEVAELGTSVTAIMRDPRGKGETGSFGWSGVGGYLVLIKAKQ